MRILSIICENYGNILKYAYILQQRLTICEKVEGFSTSAKILETMSKHSLLLQHLRQFQEQCCNRRFFLKICENISKLAETHASTSTSAIILGIMLIQSHLQHFRYFRKQCWNTRNICDNIGNNVETPTSSSTFAAISKTMLQPAHLLESTRIFFKICDNFGKNVSIYAHLLQQQWQFRENVERNI